MAKEIKRKIKAKGESQVEEVEVEVEVDDTEVESEVEDENTDTTQGTEELEVNSNLDIQVPSEDLTVAPMPELTVKIIVNRDVESYIGDRFYRISKGEEVDVPKNVKDILLQAGYIQAT